MKSSISSFMICGLIDAAFDRKKIEASRLRDLKAIDTPDERSIRAFQTATSIVAEVGVLEAVNDTPDRALNDMMIVFNHPWSIPFSQRCILLPLYLGMIVCAADKNVFESHPSFIPNLLEESPERYWNRLQISLMFTAIVASGDDAQFVGQIEPILKYNSSEVGTGGAIQDEIERIWNQSQFGGD